MNQRSIQYLFQQLDFIVKVYTELSRHEIENTISIVSETDHSNYDIFIIFVMTHGNAQGNIFCSDGRCMTVKDLMAAFVPSKCPSLSGKPKLFFIQTCRNEAEQKRAHPAAYSPSLIFPHEADFLMAFSTPPDYVDYQSVQRGTTFIQTLVDVVREYHSTSHIMDMLVVVNRRMAGYGHMQIQSPCHTLRGNVFI